MLGRGRESEILSASEVFVPAFDCGVPDKQLLVSEICLGGERPFAADGRGPEQYQAAGQPLAHQLPTGQHQQQLQTQTRLLLHALQLGLPQRLSQ